MALLEMSALGIPSIISDSGPYGDAHMSGAPSVLVLDPSGWPAGLTELLQDADARIALGQKAREWVANRTIEGNAWR
ncbi:hypothetical protein [Amycolatopsis sp. 195334CR]|uniref:glycosyltransferase n=1 Tax=Amycolatopsis sp. 195334CR TaxID=2814588 RepID=UPI001A8C2F63|nr:hypothetical protein [Amycolatopsis sp. 195334CR]